MIADKKLGEKSLWDRFELGLGSGAKFRIILHMILNPRERFTQYALVKATGVRTPAVAKQVKTLLELGWIKEDFEPDSSFKSYRISLENEVIKNLGESISKLRAIGRRE